MSGESRFGFVYDPIFLLHDTGTIPSVLPNGELLDAVEHPSSARITARIHAVLAGSGFLDRCRPLAPRPATFEELAAFHTPTYIRHVDTLCAAGSGDAGEGAPLGSHSYQAAVLAAGGALRAVDAILDGELDAAYVLARPPGHHAVADRGLGFCLFNTVALAALHARRRGLERIAIVDWDVHHGNGTQAAFYADPQVLFLSLHQEDWYPAGQGMLDERGAGQGSGFTLNVPLPPGTGDRQYLEAFETIVAPAVTRFAPQLLLVSAGQDASMLDPLGRMLVTMAGFRALGSAVRSLADRLCAGRLLLVQEGGYSAPYTPFCTLGALEGVLGHQTGVADPYAASSELARARSAYSAESARALDAARLAHRDRLEG